jgi:two-component system OmpR family sensor kinase
VVDRVARVQRLAVASVAAVAVAAGAAAGVVAALRSDDEVSLGMAGIVVGELEHHAGDTPEGLDVAVRDEVAEQRALGRVVEVWRGREPVGGGPGPPRLGAGARPDGRCGSETRQGERFRVCARTAPGGLQVLVASRSEPVVRAMATIVLAIAVAALITVALFAFVARRVVGRALAPLAELQARIAALSPRDTTARLGTRWGLREIDALAEAFDALFARIADALSRERRFLFDASHELRSPLSRLRSQLEVFQQEIAPPGGEAPERLRAAVATCEALVRVTESILALARSEAPPGETVNLCDQVRELLAALAARDPARAARVTLEAPDEALVRGDPALMDLALGNLVDNALKFSSGEVHARVARDEATGEVRFTVTDRGPGMSDDEIARAFEPFFRGDQARARTPGIGLGLALVRHVADAYGGQARIARNPAGGLEASLELPAWTPSAAR